jgi:threonine dehydratase
MADTDLVTLNEIHAARDRITGRVHRTPMLTSTMLDRALGCELHFKAELFQKTGSFKPRGMLSRILSLSADDRRRGVVTMSSGNAAAAVAFGAASVGCPATVVMPATAVRSKVEATRAYGAEVVLTEASLLDTVAELQAERGLALVHPFAGAEVIAGQGTIGLELLEDVRAPAVVVVPVGGGGLISGIAAAVKARSPATRIVGVEPDGARVITASLAAGEVVHIKPNTIADGLAAPFTTEQNLAHVRAFVDQILVLPDDVIAEAQRLVISRTKLAVEPSGAAGVAALLNGLDSIGVEPGATVVTVLSGGNFEFPR